MKLIYEGDTGVAPSNEEASTLNNVSGDQDDTTNIQGPEEASTSDCQENVAAQNTPSAGVVQGVNAGVIQASIDSEIAQQPSSDEASKTQSETHHQSEVASTFEASHIGDSSVGGIQPHNEGFVSDAKPHAPSRLKNNWKLHSILILQPLFFRKARTKKILPCSTVTKVLSLLKSYIQLLQLSHHVRNRRLLQLLPPYPFQIVRISIRQTLRAWEP